MKDKCRKNKAHDWFLCRVRFGIGLYECRVCKGHRWKRALGFYGVEKRDGDYAIVSLGPNQDLGIKTESKYGSKSKSSQQPAQVAKAKGKARVSLATQDQRRAERNAQRRRRYRLRKAAAKIAKWRFS